VTNFPFKQLGSHLSNWGRWGEADERGTLNFITPDTVRAAMGCVRSGSIFELSIPVRSDGPQRGAGNRANPLHLMSIVPGDLDTADGVSVADDYIIMPLQSGTQWDGLAHIGYDGMMYNGVPTSAVTAYRGARRNGIDRALPGMIGRGVLLDIARLRGVRWLGATDVIGPEELEGAERAQGVRLQRADALLVRTGWRRKALVDGFDGWLLSNPGLGLACAEWIHDRELATVACDNWGVEVQPAAEGWLPLHCVLVRDMGMMLGEMFDLEALSDDCAEDGQWDFLFSAAPLRISGGVGSPVSPIAIK
jgi:kynurenine formamidase